MRYLATSLAVLLLSCPALFGQSQPPSANTRATVQTIRELRAIGLPAPERNIYAPPFRVPALLRQLNEQLGQMILEVLDGTKGHVPIDLEGQILERLEAAGWRAVPTTEWNAYGELIHVQQEPANAEERGVLAVSTMLWIPCGAGPDSNLYVFRRKGDRWELALDVDLDVPSGQSEDDSDLKYALSPDESDGRWYVITARMRSDCSSRPGGVRLTAMRQGHSPREPLVLIDRTESLATDFEPSHELRAESDWFSLTVGMVRKLDHEPGVRIFRYAVGGNKVRRIQPIALDPADFLDEWTELPWSEAEEWTDQADGPTLRVWHERLRAIPEDSAEFRFVQPCRRVELDSSWMVGLWIDRKLNPSFPTETLYFLVGKRLGTFYVDHVYTVRPPGCPGNTRPIIRGRKLPSW